MKTTTRSVLIGLIAGSAMLMAGSVTIPNTFIANTSAKASEVNANFSAVKTAVDGNANDIATNENDITSNATKIGTNKSDITTNKNDIATKQNTVTGTCTVGSAVKEIKADGTVVCEPLVSGYGIITAGGHTWLDRDLGASRVAKSLTDYLAYGDLYQWGRKADGHQIVTFTNSTTGTATYGTTTEQSDDPTDHLFVKGSADWRGHSSDTLWDDSVSGGVNNVCPLGYRIPTQAEFEDVGITNGQDAFDKMRLVYAGMRVQSSGNLIQIGTNGYYWTSTASGTSATRFRINDGSFSSQSKARGRSVRCIKAE